MSELTSPGDAAESSHGARDTAPATPNNLSRREQLSLSLSAGQRRRATKAKGATSNTSDDVFGADVSEPPTPASPATPGTPGDDDERFRAIDRGTRWHTLLYASNMFHAELIKEVYGAISADDSLFLVARGKIFDNVKAYKGQVLSRMEVSISPSLRLI